MLPLSTSRVANIALIALQTILILSINVSYQQEQQEADNAATSNNNNNNSSDGVDEILKDTILLLNVLDQKLASVGNRTSNALMRDNLRSLTEPQIVTDMSDDQQQNDNNKQQEVSLEETLVKLADGFSAARKQQTFAPDEQLIMSSSNLLEQPTVLMSGSNDKRNKRGRLLSAAASRQQQQQQLESNLETNQQLASDSTERHIKFTLDLMQAIFSNQMFTSKTNSIESFLISPLSIQSVLMMMHLGSRGQTRRELANCLHLNQITSSPTVPSSSSTGSSLNNEQNNSKLKRRHQQITPASSSSTTTTTTSSSSSNGSGGENVNSKQLHSASNSNSNGKQQSSPARSQQQQAPSSQQISANNNAAAAAAHELFGGAVRNLLKNPVVTKALTSANQIFLQKNLPLSAQYEWAIRHYYAADIKLVDFQHQQQSTSSSSSSSSNSGSSSYMTAASASNNNNSSKTPSVNVAQVPSDQQQQSLATMNSSNTLSLDNNNGNLTNSTSTNANNLADQQANNLHQLINDWVERQTRGKINNFLTSPISTSTLIMAINVLYFKGDWQYKFDPSDTEQDAWFTQANGKMIKVPMMVNRLPLAFAHDPAMKTSVIELPYKAQRLGLFLLLPDEVSGIFHTMKMLNSTSFANLISSMRKPTSPPSSTSPLSNNDINQQQNPGINVRIPKFSIESSPRLSQVLTQQLGLKSLFSPDVADLSGMFASVSKPKQSSTNISSYTTEPPLQVGLDELLHKAILQVDEQGSVAAASSATIVERVGLFNSNYFEADHPFLLFLMDKQTGLVLFSGAFAGNNPTSTSTSQQSGVVNNNNNNPASTTNITSTSIGNSK